MQNYCYAFTRDLFRTSPIIHKVFLLYLSICLYFILFYFHFVAEKDINTDSILDEIFNAKETKDKNVVAEITKSNSVEDSRTNDVHRQKLNHRVKAVTSVPGDVIIEDEIRKLKLENENLKTNLTCKICIAEPIGELFLPCRHLVCCVKCAVSISKCPLCRERIVGTIKVFV